MTLFLDPSAANQFQCAICQEIYKEPVQVECDEHIFCKNCVHGLISTQGRFFQCPLCRKRCKATAVRRVKFIDRQIGNLKVKCQNKVRIQNNNVIEITTQNNNNNNNNNKPIRTESNNNHNRKRRQMNENELNLLEQSENANKKRKLNENETYQICEWQGSYSDLNDHIKTCPLQLIKCKYCSISVLQRDLTDHREKCPLFPVTCAQCNAINIVRNKMSVHINFGCPMTLINCVECKQEIQRKDENIHLHHECPEALIKCVFYEFGCKEKLKRKDEKNHIENAAFTHSHLVQISKTVKTLKDENKMLNKRVSALENKQKEIEKCLALTIYVKTLTGRTITLMMKKLDSVESLKLRLLLKEGWPVSKQYLVFANMEMEDHRTLLSYNISHGSSVHIVLRS